MSDKIPRPLVSVVIPCFNQAHFVAFAIASALGQEYRPLEVLVVDDGSTDDTANVAISNGAELVQTPHGGVSSARNHGLAHARGEFIVFLDADDELLPKAVESSVAELQRHPRAGCVVGRAQLIDAEGRQLPTTHTGPQPGELYPQLLVRNFFYTPGSAMFRRSVVQELHGFREDVSPAADYALYLNLARRRQIVIEARVVVGYRQHDDNMSRDASRMLRSTLAVLKSERPHVPPAYHAAYRTGVKAWQLYFGDQIATQLQAALRERRWSLRECASLVTLATQAPAVFLTHIRRKLTRLAGRHRPVELRP